jgi:hypothetical protein
MDFCLQLGDEIVVAGRRFDRLALDDPQVA